MILKYLILTVYLIMGVPRETYLFFLTDSLGRSYFVDDKNTVKYKNTPAWLPEAPDGWQDIQLSFARNTTYYGINRSFSPALRFVGDGGQIIRYLFYNKKGVDQQIFLNVNKWDDKTGIYQPYYKGQLDLSKMDDESAIGVTVPMLESGLLQLFKANENNTFEFPCDGTDPRNIRARLDGIEFHDIFHYNGYSYNQEISSFTGAYKYYTIGIVYLNNEADNIGIEHGDQAPNEYDDTTSLLASGNYLFSSDQSIDVTITGKRTYRINFSAPGGFKISILLLFGSTEIVLSPETTYLDSQNGLVVTLDIGAALLSATGQSYVTIDRADQIFIVAKTIAIVNTAIYSLDLGDNEAIDFSFDSQYQETLAWAWKPYDLLNALVQKFTNNLYSAKSDLLQNDYSHLILTSGAALRQNTGATIKVSISDFFKAFNSILNASLGIVPAGNVSYDVLISASTNTAYLSESGNTLSYDTIFGFDVSPGDILRISNDPFNNGIYTVGSVAETMTGKLITFSDGEIQHDEINVSITLEKLQKNISTADALFLESKEYVFDDTDIDMDLGEVSGLRIAPYLDYFFNNLKIGYPEQQYDEKAGQYEYNTTAEWQSPIQTISSKSIELISPFRADSYGIEYTRFLTLGNDTVNNKSDNDVFVIAVDKNSVVPVVATVSFVASGNYMITPLGINFAPGVTIKITGSTSNDNSRKILDVAVLLGIAQIVSFDGGTTVDESSVSVQIDFLTGAIYDLLRETYDSITGVVNPDTAFNIEDLTPKRMLSKHGNFIRGSLHNRVTEYIQFLNLSKNKELATQKGTTYFIEKTDKLIGEFDKPLFYPYQVSFTTKVPLTFEEIMDVAANGHIRGTYNGVPFYGYPMEVSVKPTLNDSQEWKLLLSPRTDLSGLQDLDINGLNFIVMSDYMVFVPHLCPVKFVPLGSTFPSQYHFKNMDDWWHSEQIQFYVQQNTYAAKWQTNDTIALQVQTNGLAPAQVQLLDCSGSVLQTVSLATKSDPAIISPMVLFEGNVSLTGLDEGYYYLLLTAGTGGTLAQMISEPLHVKADHDNTLLFEYTNSKNKQACVFSTGYSPSFRVEGWLDEFQPDGSFTSYVNQPGDIETLNGIPFRTYNLNIGSNTGLPDWAADKVNRIMMLNSVTIDGNYFNRDSDAKMEKTSVPGSPLKFWILKVREGKNRDGVSVSTDGTLDNQLTVAYNINTKAFGDGATTDNIVQVTQVD